MREGLESSSLLLVNSANALRTIPLVTSFLSVAACGIRTNLLRREKRNLPHAALMGSQQNLCRLKPHGCSAAVWMLQLRHQESSTCPNQPRRHLLLSRCTCGQKPQISLNPRTVTLICLSFLQCDGTCVDCSTSCATVRKLYHGSCIVRWCTKTSPRRLFRVPKDNRMEAFLKYAERPQLIGLPKEVVHYYRVCSPHFTELDYKDMAKTKLRWLAVLSIKAPDESKGDAASPRHLRELPPQPGPSGL
ncbi:uncharacterized protein [Dermacentor andersoni]|uniref:uncharacterized protein isoform X2 n=1 Tax=Dermacentor andersoni TaxID=34620 RepID=UPI003B3BB6A4